MFLSTQQTGRDMAFLQCGSAGECVGSPCERKLCHNPETNREINRHIHTQLHYRNSITNSKRGISM